MYFLSLVLYAVSICLTIVSTIKNLSLKKTTILCFVAAFLFHLVLLYTEIETTHGQNLNQLNIISLSMCITNLLVILTAIRKFYPSLITTVSCLSVIIISTSAIIKVDNAILITKTNPKNLVHIFVAVLSLSILILTAVQSIMAIFHKYYLKHFKSSYLEFLEPLEDTESYLSKMILTGFILVSVLLLSMLSMNFSYSINNFISIFFGITIWVLLGTLLYLRHRYGLRGIKSNIAILVSVLILLTSFLNHQYLL